MEESSIKLDDLASPKAEGQGTGTNDGFDDVHKTPKNKIPEKRQKMSQKGLRTSKKYNPRWEQDDILKRWLSPHPRDNGKAICRFCKSEIRAQKNDLLEHGKTQKHIRNFANQCAPEEYTELVTKLGIKLEDPKKLVNKSPSITIIAGASTTTASGNPNNNDISILYAVNGNSTGDPLSTITTQALPDFATSVGRPDENNGMSDFLRLTPHEESEMNRFLYADGFGDSDSPSDLVSVILEEQQSPQQISPKAKKLTQLDNSIRTGVDGLNTIVLNQLSTNPSGFSMNLNILGAVETSDVTAQSTTIQMDHPESIEPQAPATASNHETEGHQTLLLAKPVTPPPITLPDVLTAINEGRFLFSELCSLAKATTAQIDRVINGTYLSGPVNGPPAGTNCDFNLTSEPLTVSVDDIPPDGSHIQLQPVVPTSNIFFLKKDRLTRKKKVPENPPMPGLN